MSRTAYTILLGFLCLGGGFGLGWFLHQPAVLEPISLRQSDIASSTYDFIDPLLAVHNPGQGNSPAYDTLLNRVNTLIAEAKQQQTLQTASVYFRDLGQSQGFVVNDTEQYSPASLLKVPTMMTYFKLSESNRTLLYATATYSGATDADAQEYIKSPVQLAPGTYSIATLLQHMVENSDNNAAETLITHLNEMGDTEAFQTLFNDLGVSKIDVTNDFITVRGYALFFRVLYNATYLNRDNSEQALKLLSQTDFNAALRAGVPQEVPVAHKFGEFSLQDQKGTLLKRELHDCGIVYYPSHPYLLCVMTKGNDFLALQNSIKDISAAAYQFMTATYPH